jgi:hypothetical protein
VIPLLKNPHFELIRHDVSIPFQAEVDPAEKTVTVEAANEEEIAKGAEALKKLGYPLAGEDSGLMDKAKSFVSCAVGKLG